MDKQEYARLIEKNMQGFWQPGQRLRVVRAFVAKPEYNLKCQLCLWPQTSSKPVSGGLKNIYVLQNVDTGNYRLIGCRCAEAYQAYIKDTYDSGFEVKGLKEAKKAYRAKYRSSKQGRQQQSPRKSSDFDRRCDVYLDEEEWEAHYNKSEQDEIISELRSPETYYYYFEDDPYDEVCSDPKRNQGPRCLDTQP